MGTLVHTCSDGQSFRVSDMTSPDAENFRNAVATHFCFDCHAHQKERHEAVHGQNRVFPSAVKFSSEHTSAREHDSHIVIKTVLVVEHDDSFATRF